MSRSIYGPGFCLTALFLISTGTAKAATLYVNCAAKEGLHSIGAALKVLQNVPGPSTINVSGACHENVVLQNIDRLTIAGSKGASITDASGGAADVVDIRNSNVTITDMTIDGLSGVNNDTVDCEQGSHCTLLGNTIQGAAEPVGIYSTASAVIVGGVLQNGTSDGLFAVGEVVLVGVLIQGNPVGLVVRFGGRARTGFDLASFPVVGRSPTTIENNGAGVDALQAQFACAGCVIRGNSGDGVHADMSTAVRVGPGFLIDGSSVAPSVTGNTGHGVYLGDLSSGIFAGPPSTVTGNGQPDIVCYSTTSVSRAALTAADGAAHTNCTN
jgi:hypothetical protein